jgi:hypothetical protein
MRHSPSIVPHVADRDVYLVLDDFGKLGRSWREADEDRSGRVTVLQDLMEGQFNSPVRVIAFNTAEGWSRDVTADVARELAQKYVDRDEDVPGALKDFIESHGG